LTIPPRKPTIEGMNEHSTKEPVTVLGLGAMGRAIAASLLDAGHPVTVWNRTSGRANELVERGAMSAADVVEAVNASELVLVCVLDSAAVGEVLAAAGDAVRGRTIVNLATGTPAEARTIATVTTAQGAAYLDGVMLAVPAMIGTPQAMILYGGSSDAHARHHATLAAFAANSPLLGDDVGLPALYDVALLTLLYTTLTGWLQAFAVVGAGGVSATDFLPYATPWFDNVVVADDPRSVAQAVDRREYPDTVPSSLGLNAAALRLLIEVQHDIGIDSSVIEAIGRLADQAVADGHGADGYTSLIEAIRSPKPRAEVAA
jgi:3-hydroxyisobutyrate dehydrogenase-like beta-hydroxyacid dehydrogenase